jgi:hypothetical protein
MRKVYLHGSFCVMRKNFHYYFRKQDFFAGAMRRIVFGPALAAERRGGSKFS